MLLASKVKILGLRSRHSRPLRNSPRRREGRRSRSRRGAGHDGDRHLLRHQGLHRPRRSAEPRAISRPPQSLLFGLGRRRRSARRPARRHCGRLGPRRLRASSARKTPPSAPWACARDFIAELPGLRDDLQSASLPCALRRQHRHAFGGHSGRGLGRAGLEAARRLRRGRLDGGPPGLPLQGIPAGPPPLAVGLPPARAREPGPPGAHRRGAITQQHPARPRVRNASSCPNRYCRSTFYPLCRAGLVR